MTRPHPYTDAAGRLTPAGWQLVIDYNRLVWAVLRRRFARAAGDPEAHSAGQDGLIDAARGYDPTRGAFSTYAYPIIRYRVARWLTARDQRHARESAAAAEADTIPAGVGPEAAAAAAAEEAEETRADVAALLAAAAELPAPLRAVIEAMAAGGSSAVKAAELLGVTPQQVRNTLMKLRTPP